MSKRSYLRCCWCNRVWNVSAITTYRGWYKCPDCEAREAKRKKKKEKVKDGHR